VILFVDRGKPGYPDRGRGIAPSGAVSREAPLGQTHPSSEASDPSGAKQMMATYGRVVRRSAALTGAVAAVCVAVCAALGGAKGLYGALIGVAIVTAFFGISVLVVGRAAKISPQVMMAAALISYVVKIIGFAIVVILLGKSTAFNGRMLGFTAIICILAWTAAEVVTAIKLRLPYVDPDGSGKA
jgi:ATP synthase protein I